MSISEGKEVKEGRKGGQRVREVVGITVPIYY